MGFKITMQNGISPEMLKPPCEQAEKLLAIQMHKDTMPFVPALTGSLNVRSHVAGNTIIYPGPYAQYLYYGKVMVDPKTGAAGFRLPDGTWRSRRGVAKVLTDRDLQFNTAFHAKAQAHWFEASRAENEDKWLRVAKAAIKHFLGGKR